MHYWKKIKTLDDELKLNRRVHFLDNSIVPCLGFVLINLTILRDNNFKNIYSSHYGLSMINKHNIVYLESSNNLFFYKAIMSRGINENALVIGNLKLSQGNINSDTMLTLSQELVNHSHILEWIFVHLSSFLFETLTKMLLNTSNLIDQVFNGGIVWEWVLFNLKGWKRWPFFRRHFWSVLGFCFRREWILCLKRQRSVLGICEM